MNIIFYVWFYLFSEQVVIFSIGNIPSRYYKVFGTKDSSGFKETTILAAVLILSEAFVSN